MNLPKITGKQAAILELLYKYRFLNRIQIQSLMHHKDYKTINVWLKDLREKQYVERIYSDHFLEKTKPAMYYLGSNGVRYLKTLVWDDDSAVYPLEELHKRYKEGQRSQPFIDHSILVADCCTTLEALSRGTGTRYACITEADYLNPEHAYNFLSQHEKLRPSLCIVKQKGQTTTHYLLEMLDPTLPQYRVRSRIKNYVTYLIDDEWEGDDPAPIILLVLPNVYSLIYAKRKVRQLFLDEYDGAEDIPPDLRIRFTTAEQLQAHGIAANIWEEGRKRPGL